MRFQLLLLASAFSSVLGRSIVKRTFVPSRTELSPRDDLPALNPPVSAIVNHNLETRKEVRQTNAQRLARGLPPLPPARRWGDKPTAPKTSAGACTQHTILISSATTPGTPLGYLSKTLNSFGEFANTVTTSTDPDALLVCVSRPAPNSHLSDISLINGAVSTLGFLGALKGFKNTDTTISASLPNYLFLAQVTQTGPSATPSIPTTSTPQTSTSFGLATDIPEEWESNIWSVNAATGVLQLLWTNLDGTATQAQVLYLPSDGLFVATGDPESFVTTYGRSDAAVVTFSLA